MSATQIKTEQAKIADTIAQQFDIDRERIYFLNERKPLEFWVPPDQTLKAARQVGGFKRVEELEASFIPPPLNQIIHRALVENNDGVQFVRIGVATIGSKTPQGVEMDPHQLAGGHPILAALTDAGCNPFKVTPAKRPSIASVEAVGDSDDDSPYQRDRDLAAIHALAEQCDMVFWDQGAGRKNDKRYRAFIKEIAKEMGLGENVTSVVRFNQQQRATVIEALRHRANAESL